MLKSTQNPLSKEQFMRLRESRALIKEQFDEVFSLQSETVIEDLYVYALRSKTNELFRQFSTLNEISGEPVNEPLNEEQFILLRQAREIIEEESGATINLAAQDVMDSLYISALSSRQEDLYDIHRYLNSREAVIQGNPDAQQDAQLAGTYFRKLREANRIAHAIAHENDTTESDTRSGNDVETGNPPNPLTSEALAELAMRSDDASLIDAVNWLQKWTPGEPATTELLFHELSAPDFERLRDAKQDITAEFDDSLSLHGETALDDLYRFALRSRDTILFDLFCDLLEPQMTPRSNSERPAHWFSRDQYTLLRAAREAILAEFDDHLDITSSDVYAQLYGYALRADEEDLFDLCKELCNLGAPAPDDLNLPSKDEFRALRRGQALIRDEFGENLELHTPDIRDAMYRYAVSSERDELFDIHLDLDALDDTNEPSDSVRLTRDEFVALREARILVREEFSEHLALEDPDVLDQLYNFALQSAQETLFDLHAELNARAQSTPALTKEMQEENREEKGKEEREKNAESEQNPATVTTTEAIVGAHEIVEEIELLAPPESDPANAGVGRHPRKTEAPAPRGIKRIFGLLRATPKPDAPAPTDKSAIPAATDLLSPTHREPEPEEQSAPETPASDAAVPPSSLGETDTNHTSFPDLLVRAIDQAPKNKVTPSTEEQKPAGQKKRRGKPQRRRASSVQVKEVKLPTAAQSAHQNNSPSDSARGPASAPNVAPTTTATPQHVKEGWYISTMDDRLRVRLATQLSVGTDGELLIAAPPGVSTAAIIETTNDGPAIIARQGELKVNGEVVDKRRALTSGDRIAVAGTELQVEYASRDGAAALSAGG